MHRRRPEARIAMALLLGVAAGVGGAAASLPSTAVEEGTTAETESTVGPRTTAESGSIEEARELLVARDLDAAEAAARSLLARAEADHDTDSLQVAEILDILTEALWRAGKAENSDALTLARRAVEIKQSRLDPADPGTANSLRNLALVMRESGDFEEAEANFHHVISIRAQAFGPTHPKVALAIRDLANLHLIGGKFTQARRRYEEALKIQEVALDPDDRQLAVTLNNLANALQRDGRYEEALPVYERALSIKSRSPDSNELDRAWTINGLAILHEDLGNYTEAQRLYERTLEIRESVLGADNIQVANTLVNLANLERQQGDFRQAKMAIERALEIGERALGIDSLFVAVAQDNQAEILFLSGEIQQAMAIKRESLAKRRATQGESHPDYAWSLVGLADLYAALGDFDPARAAYESALALQTAQLGRDTPFAAETSTKLGRLFVGWGRFTESRPHLESSLAARERALGPEHPKVGATLKPLSVALASQGETDAALQASLRAEEIGRKHLQLTSRVLPERKVLLYAAVRPTGLGLALSLLAQGRAPEAVPATWDAVVRSRALVLDEIAVRNRAVSGSASSEVARRTLEVKAARRHLATTILRGSEGLAPDRYRTELEEAQRRKDGAERAMAEISAGFRRQQERRDAGYEEMRQALPDTTALVAFAQYEHFALDRNGGDPSSPRSTVRPRAYGAFVQPPFGKPPVFVPLGLAGPIDRSVARWTKEIRRGATLSIRSSGDIATETRASGESLRRIVWDAIQPHVARASLVLVVPDGSLNLVNLSALPVGSHQFLIDRGPRIHYLSAERDVASHSEHADKGLGLLVLGGAAFDRSAVAAPTSEESAATRGAACPQLRSLRFDSLPASAVEVDQIAALWNEVSTTSRSGSAVPVAMPVKLTGYAATEEAFKRQSAGKRVLHMATHGFFLGGECADSGPSTRGIGSIASAPDLAAEWAAEALAVENPLVLSGLALAGANDRASAAGSEDGILTAEEVAGLDLFGVEWAVLSACDTGLGAVEAGEGVFGLRRAFEVAGARTVIMSLWSVDDDAASDWMEALYRGRLIEGLSTDRAVHQASLTVLNRRRADNASTHAFYWAGFVAAGDWR